MATAAFKSTSKRGSLTSDNPNSNSNSNTEKVAPRRRTRSLSVSAVPRSRASQLDIPCDILHRRDNPLFCSAVVDNETQPLRPAGNSNSNLNLNSNAATTTSDALTSKPSTAGQRGRSVTRNSGGGKKKEAGRSLSRVDLGCRSISRGHIHNGASESEVEQESDVSSNYGKTYNSNFSSRNVTKRSTVANAFPNWENGVSTVEAEEKTIKAVCEQMKGDLVEGDTGTTGIYETVRSEVRRAISDIQNDLETVIRRNNSNAVVTADIINDVPSDMRREYAKKLEESQERARKLRADLTVEEQHGQELSRILREILPNPKTSTTHRSRQARRSSSERKKMSKRLSEEAMSYFDECVSISTFDSSDFSAPEDRPHFSASPPMTQYYLPQESPCVSSSYETNNCLVNKQEALSHTRLMHSGEESILTASSSSNEAMVSCKRSQFSFAHSPKENTTMFGYIKDFEKEGFVNTNVVNNDLESYDDTRAAENLLFDKVLLKSRIESGGLHICGGGGFSFTLYPFASVV